MNRLTAFFAVLLMFVIASCKEPMAVLTDRVFREARMRYVEMDKAIDEYSMPRSFVDGRFIQCKKNNWVSGFYPGTLWYIYEYTGDNAIRILADKHTRRLDSLYYMRTHHDIGFQTQASYLNGYRLTGNSEYLPFIERNASKLAARFSDVTGCIKSWDSEEWDYPVIIDNMMNLEHLMVASKLFDADSLADIACTHANTTMRNHFRPDFTTYHLLDYSSETGQVRKKQTYQGAADESAWARGQAWALYGYAMMAEKSSDRKAFSAYLLQAEKVAEMLLEKLPEDGIPYWDFDSENIPDEYKDASAAAVMASGFITVSRITEKGRLSRECRHMAETQIRTLASEKYLAEAGTNGNFLLMHSVGNYPFSVEVDAPLTYADYYFLEALIKFRSL